MGNAVSVRVDDGEQICARCLDDGFISDRVVRFAAKTTCAPMLRRWNSVRCHFVHHGLPGAVRHVRIMRGKVGAGQIEIEGRLSMRFVHRIQQPFSFVPIACAECCLFPRIVFLPIKNAVTPAIESIF
jgi:hypothetical protein